MRSLTPLSFLRSFPSFCLSYFPLYCAFWLFCFRICNFLVFSSLFFLFFVCLSSFVVMSFCLDFFFVFPSVLSPFSFYFPLSLSWRFILCLFSYPFLSFIYLASLSFSSFRLSLILPIYFLPFRTFRTLSLFFSLRPFPFLISVLSFFSPLSSLFSPILSSSPFTFSSSPL